MASQGKTTVVNSVLLRDIVVQKDLSTVPLEVSGLCYLPDRAGYLVVSDETDEKRAELFLMNNTGYIEKKTLVQGLSKINDLEGIAQGKNDILYLLSSQSYNKKDEQSSARKILARVRRDGTSLFLDKNVLLADCLLAAAAAAGKQPWADFIRSASSGKTIDIEGIAWRQDSLFLGFKNPKIMNKAVILVISNSDILFERNQLRSEQVAIWRTLSLVDTATATFCGVSDLLFQGDFLYGVATGVASQSGVGEDIGLFWQYTPATGALKVLRSFSGRKPEGIACTGTPNEFCITFDNGSRNSSQLLTVKVSE